MSAEIITIGGGCFWCIEAVMQRVKGVTKVESGYSGGLAPGYPTYREVCSGLTGHAEVVRVTFENKEISLHDLLTIFMTLHDPTQLNRQGADLGTQYRSVIYYQSDDQRATANAVFIELKDYFDAPLVTELSPAPPFYLAEADHHDYYNQNSQAGYCIAVIQPKLTKLRSKYVERFVE
ncbi:MAG: peptide-methionine (S)-S-oxide reductase [Flammeovirgaceae bacterium TMED32]|nr:MAG: peptide-methionine (S)-S-oxide reductase [Flammeovirgaceae bacterium TMED32]|tara:strand:+ start:430 stop:963 length:534 start_codon:yes stop_codon:yes gene_type:complete